MPPCGTFRYAGIVPDDLRRAGGWKLKDQSGAPAGILGFLSGRGDSLFRNRLVGLQPNVEISDRHVILKASGRRRAQVRSAAIELDAPLIDVFKGGDVLSVVRTATADIGVSLLRATQLVFAVGAVTEVSLGGDVTVRGGPELNFAAPDSDQWPRAETWVDVSTSGTATRLRGNEESSIGHYRFSVLRCFEDGIPGTYECLAISLNEVCPHGAALRSAKLLARSNAGLVMKEWS